MPEDAIPDGDLHGDTPPEDALPEVLPVDPLPEWVWRSWPVDEPDPDPGECLPGNMYIPNSQLPGWPLHGDAFPDWAEFLTQDEHITS